jgi:hypothetical protein
LGASIDANAALREADIPSAPKYIATIVQPLSAAGVVFSVSARDAHRREEGLRPITELTTTLSKWNIVSPPLAYCRADHDGRILAAATSASL